MPAKNSAEFLKECVDSILAQDYKNWELLVVDDHSEDDTYSILERYGLKDKRIIPLKNQGHGIIDALRMANMNASGNYITRMDSDDIMHPEKIGLLLKQLTLKGNGHIVVGLVHYFSKEALGEGYRVYAQWLNELCLAENNFEDIYKECTIPSPCWMISKEDLEAAGAFSPNTYPEDYDLAFRFRKRNLKITAVKKIIHYWRDHASRTSRNDEHYADNNFANLKVQHFVDQDRNRKFPLVLWGAGRKGKKIASLLKKQKLDFNWVCNNENKLGKDIYGYLLKDYQNLREMESAQVIVAVKSLEDADDIENFILENPKHAYFRFS